MTKRRRAQTCIAKTFIAKTFMDLERIIVRIIVSWEYLGEDDKSGVDGGAGAIVPAIVVKE